MPAYRVNGQPAYLVTRAKELRRKYRFAARGTLPEGRLYHRLKDLIDNRIRLQLPMSHPEGDMIVDLAILKSDLVIELMDYDADRDRRIKSFGFDTLWINRDLVNKDLEYVVQMVMDRLSRSS